MILTYLLTVISLFFSICAHSATLETYDLEDIIPCINEAMDQGNTLILFDLDDTLIDPQISLHSDPWIAYYWRTAPKLMPEKMYVVEELMWHISKSVPMHAVDRLAASLIISMQNCKSMTTLALTARPPFQKRIDGIQVTADQLRGVNIDFSQAAFPASFAQHAAFHKGIIFTSGKMKGDFLKHFLTFTQHSPDKVIFIDDKLDQILSVEQAMQEAGIPVQAFWFRKVSLNRSAFNPQIANIQLEYLLKFDLILNDHEAGALLADYSHIPPDAFLKQLIEFYEKQNIPKAA